MSKMWPGRVSALMSSLTGPYLTTFVDTKSITALRTQRREIAFERLRMRGQVDRGRICEPEVVASSPRQTSANGFTGVFATCVGQSDESSCMMDHQHGGVHFRAL